MARNIWTRIDKLARELHLYTGLFLVPWMLVYATSAFFLNHGNWLPIGRPEWKPINEVKLGPDEVFHGEPAEQARAILQHLGMDGAHRVLGKPNPNQLVVIHLNGTGNQRITWRKEQYLLVVEKQEPFAFRRLTHFLHFRAGYGQPYWQYILWAVMIDAVIVSMWLWVISGIYLYLGSGSQQAQVGHSITGRGRDAVCDPGNCAVQLKPVRLRVRIPIRPSVGSDRSRPPR